MTLRRNQRPEVNAIKLLDARGFAMGPVTEITEGRGLVVQVQASDPEVGVQNASLFYSIGPADAQPVFHQALLAGMAGQRQRIASLIQRAPPGRGLAGPRRVVAGQLGQQRLHAVAPAAVQEPGAQRAAAAPARRRGRAVEHAQLGLGQRRHPQRVGVAAL